MHGLLGAVGPEYRLPPALTLLALRQSCGANIARGVAMRWYFPQEGRHDKAQEVASAGASAEGSAATRRGKRRGAAGREAEPFSLPLAADTAPGRCSSREPIGPETPSSTRPPRHRDRCRLTRGLGALIRSSGGPESCTHPSATRFTPRGTPPLPIGSRKKEKKRVLRLIRGRRIVRHQRTPFGEKTR